MAFNKKLYVVRYCKAIASQNGFYDEIKGKKYEEIVKIVLTKKGIKISDTITPKRLFANASRMLSNGVFKKKPTPPQFYDSLGWLYIRRELFGLYGRHCMKCKRYDYSAHADHIKPRSKYPELELDINNLQVLCGKCNQEKSNLHETDYRTKLPREEWAKLINTVAQKKNEQFYKTISEKTKHRINNSKKKLAR